MEMSAYAALVAQRVTEALSSADKSQLWLSETTGIPRTTLLRRLAGHAPFSVAELAAIADALGIQVDDLTRTAA